MIDTAPNLNILWASLLVEELVRNGIDYFCLAPGSRSSPLTVSLASQPRVKVRVHYDERGAAFHALGYARARGVPAVLVTTSGTAVANAWPAVVEASLDRVPLLLLTADRPPELQDTGANQTIDQIKFFGDYVRWRHHLVCPTKDMEPAAILTAVDQAVYRARTAPAGPVHFNCMFREPLAPENAEEDYAPYLAKLSEWLAGSRPYTSYIGAEREPEPDTPGELAGILGTVERGLLVVGALNGEPDRQATMELANRLGWPLLPDVTSGLRLGTPPENAVPYYDMVLCSPEFALRHAPQMVLHLGGQITSKRLLDYIARSRPEHYLCVDRYPGRFDPLHGVTQRFDATVASFCRRVLPVISKGVVDKRWRAAWQEASQRVGQAMDASLSCAAPLSEPLTAHVVSRLLPPGHAMFLASSMPIRDMDAFGQSGGAGVPIASNRGASGIDGTIATATGFAQGLKRPVTLMIGDLALLHDLNSLGLARVIDSPIIVVVLNNNGGGIFSFLPISQFREVFERYFATPHGLTFESAARLFDLEYYRPASPQDLERDYDRAVRGGHASLIEILGDREENHSLHVALQKAARASLEAGHGG